MISLVNLKVKIQMMLKRYGYVLPNYIYVLCQHSLLHTEDSHFLNTNIY